MEAPPDDCSFPESRTILEGPPDDYSNPESRTILEGPPDDYSFPESRTILERPPDEFLFPYRSMIHRDRSVEPDECVIERFAHSNELDAMREKAHALFKKGDYEKSLALYKSAQRFANRHKDEFGALQVRIMVLACHALLSDSKEVLRLCKRLEPDVIRNFGLDATTLATVLMRKARALLKLERFKEAQVAGLECLRITILADGKQGDTYILGLLTLAEIANDEERNEEGLKYILEARALLGPDSESTHMMSALNLHALFLFALGFHQDALIIRNQALALSYRVEGPDHPGYAMSCLNTARFYSQLNQFERGIELLNEALAIFTKTLGPSHTSTQATRNSLVAFHDAQSDKKMRHIVVKTLNRMCSIPQCNNVEQAMDRCTSCERHYLCKEHKKLITKHVPLCPKFEDLLPSEKKLAAIIKCRRCRKQTKLMKCSVCEKVWYCSAQCQKDDWKRHKLFCRK